MSEASAATRVAPPLDVRGVHHGRVDNGSYIYLEIDDDDFNSSNRKDRLIVGRRKGFSICVRGFQSTVFNYLT